MVASSSIQLLTFNLAAASVRKVTHNGRDYLVAPASLIVPGVLNGSDGPGYYPPDETSRNVASWDDMPIVVYHPTKDGQPIAAQDPQHREHVGKSTVGFLKNTRFKDRLLSEAWFDVAQTQNYDAQLPQWAKMMPRLTSNQPIELSTGLHVDRDETPGKCPKTGRAYTWVARNHRPDHLAVLPDQRGACSIQDGCGVVMNTNNAEDEGQWVTLPNGVHVQVKDGEIVKGPKIKSEYKSKEEADKALDKHSKSNKTHKFPHGPNILEGSETSTEKATFNAGKYGNPQHREHGKFLPHGSGTGKGDVHEAAVDGHKKCGCGGDCDKCKKAVENSNPEGCNQYKDCAGAAGEASKKAAKSGKKEDHEAAVKAHEKAAEHAPGDNERLNHWDSASHHEFKAKDITSVRSGSFQDARKQAGTRQIRADEGRLPKRNQGEVTMATISSAERQGLVNKIVANCQCEGNDTSVINSLSDAALMQLNAMAEAAPEDDSEVVEEEAVTPKGKFAPKGKVPPQFAKNSSQMSDQEYLDMAPPNIRRAIVNSLKIERAARQQLIGKLVANAAEASRPKYETFLSNKSLDELETLVEMIPAGVQNRETDSLFGPVFLGAAGGHEGQNSPTYNRDQMTFNADADPEMDPQYHARQATKK